MSSDINIFHFMILLNIYITFTTINFIFLNAFNKHIYLILAYNHDKTKRKKNIYLRLKDASRKHPLLDFFKYNFSYTLQK